MIKVLEIIKKYAHLLVFAILFFISLILLVNNHNYQQSLWLNSANQLSGGLYTIRNSVASYIGLQERNSKLQSENRLLREQLLAKKPVGVDVQWDTNYSKEFEVIQAQVIKNSFNRKSNYLTLNRGSKHGVEEGMGVISTNGIVGYVKTVSCNYSLIISCLNMKEFGVSSSLLPLEINDAVLKWDGEDVHVMKLEGVSKFENIKKEMELVTGPYNRRFPKGTSIGKVVNFSKPQNGAFYDIDIKLSTDFTRVKEVYVIRDLWKNELDSLNNQVVGQ